MFSFTLAIVFVVLGFVVKRMTNDAKRESKVDTYKKRLLVISHD